MVKFWDSRTCTQLQSFQGHGADVLCLTISPVRFYFHLFCYVITPFSARKDQQCIHRGSTRKSPNSHTSKRQLLEARLFFILLAGGCNHVPVECIRMMSAHWLSGHPTLPSHHHTSENFQWMLLRSWPPVDWTCQWFLRLPRRRPAPSSPK
jgi:hypothetical protein